MRKALTSMASALALTAALGATAAIAQNNPLSNRQEDTPPALAFLQSQGVKLTYLGDEGGVRGYLGENPGGKMQTFYLTPDGSHVIAGVMFRSGGINVTGVQIGDMQQRFNDARKQLGGALETTESSTDLPLAAPAPQPAISPAPAPEAAPLEIPAPQAAKAETPAVESATNEAPSAEAYRSTLDKDDFIKQVKDVAWFSVGAPDTPVVYMVADPQCPFCHSAWSKLRPLVIDRKLAVNVILINGLKGSEPLAISLLSRPEPGTAWFAGEGSERGVAIAPPPAPGSEAYDTAKTFLSINNRFARDVGLSGTPFFAYVGKDGHLYSAEGPRDLDAFLSAL